MAEIYQIPIAIHYVQSEINQLYWEIIKPSNNNTENLKNTIFIQIQINDQQIQFYNTIRENAESQ